MYSEAWRAAVHGVAKNQTGLSDWIDWKLQCLKYIKYKLCIPVPEQWGRRKNSTFVFSYHLNVRGCGKVIVSLALPTNVAATPGRHTAFRSCQLPWFSEWWGRISQLGLTLLDSQGFSPPHGAVPASPCKLLCLLHFQRNPETIAKCLGTKAPLTWIRLEFIDVCLTCLLHSQSWVL